MKIFSKLLALIIAVSLVVSLVSCGANTSDTESEGETVDPQYAALAEGVGGYLLGYADLAYDNMISNYWTGPVSPGGKFANSYYHIFWEYAQVLLGFETLYKATGNEEIKDYIYAQFFFWTATKFDSWITSAGENNNPAADDAAWTAMLMLVVYEATGDERALKLCEETIRKAYDFWADDEGIEHGIYYRKISPAFPDNDDMTKTLYAVGLMYSALRYHEITTGTERENLELYNDTLALYNWTEEYLLRDGSKEYEGVTIANDYLYYNDFTDDPEEGIYRPTYLYSPNQYGASSLFGNMGMACIHKKLYDLTGDAEYLSRAVRTANAIASADYYDYNGMLVNDRDAWTDASFIGYFTSEVMTIDGVDRELGRMLMKTAHSIMNNCYYEGGYYGGDWNEARYWYNGGNYTEFGNPATIMTSATTTHVLYAAALAAELGLIDYEEGDLELFSGGYGTPPALSEAMYQHALREGWIVE